MGNRDWEGRAYGNVGYDCFNIEYERQIKKELNEVRTVRDDDGAVQVYRSSRNLCGHYPKLSRKHKQPLPLFKLCRRCTNQSSVSDNLKEAIECCTAELGIAREVGNKIHEGEACFVLGHCFEYMGSWGAALSYYQSSVKLVNDVRHLLPPKDDWKMNLRDQFQSSYIVPCVEFCWIKGKQLKLSVQLSKVAHNP